MGKGKAGRKKKRVERPPDTSKRKFVILGLGTLATSGAALAGYKSGWFGSPPAPQPTPLPTVAPTPSPLATATRAASSAFRPATYPADRQNAVRAADEMLTFFARDMRNPSILIHAVRGIGKDFAMEDGTKAVDILCAGYAAEKEVNGKRYVYFPRSVEVHDNSFLKTFLEAGVSRDQPIRVAGNQYTLRDLGEHAKSLFRCDPQDLFRYDKDLIHEHLPWGLIAFSILVPPSQPSWTNAYGETINLPEVIDRSLAAYERTCTLAREPLEKNQNESDLFRKEIKEYSCFGMHSVYGYLACYQNGYRDNDLAERLRQMLDLVTLRLKGDPEAIDREYAAELQKNPASAQIVEVVRVRAQIKFLGHAFEAINYALLHRFFTPTAEQKRRMQAGERLLYENMVKMRGFDLEAIRRMHPRLEKEVSDVMIAVGHAARAMKLLTPQNPDLLAKK